MTSTQINLGSKSPAPYAAGRDAYAQGTPVGRNPFPHSDDAHWAWRNGWLAAHEAMFGAHVVEA